MKIRTFFVFLWNYLKYIFCIVSKYQILISLPFPIGRGQGGLENSLKPSIDIKKSFPEKYNQFGQAVSEIFSFRQKNTTFYYRITKYLSELCFFIAHLQYDLCITYVLTWFADKHELLLITLFFISKYCVFLSLPRYL